MNGLLSLDASDSAWTDVLSRMPHDVYHLPAYARLCETHEPWRVRLAVVEHGQDVLAMPYMLRTLPPDVAARDDLVDVTVPYGYPGPVCSSTELSVQRDLFREMLRGFADLGAVSLFVRNNPFVGLPATALEPFGEIVVHGHVAYVDLTALGEPTVAGFRADHRRNIRILREKGFDIAVDREEDFPSFIQQYYEAMRRLSSDPYYLFPDAYFETLRRDLADYVHLVTALAPNGEVAASALTFVCGDVAQYHLSGSNDAYFKLAPSKLSVLGMIELDRDLGARTLNLGGGLGGRDDALFTFKAGFTKCRKPFTTGRFILDDELYSALSAGRSAPEGFFPAYRHGL